MAENLTGADSSRPVADLDELDPGRTSRMFAALYATNEAMVQATSPQELLRRVCAAIAYGAKFLAATVLEVQPGARWATVSAATWGSDDGAQARISVDESLPEGRGLVGTAYRQRQPCISNDFQGDPRTTPWHDMARARGVHAGVALPLSSDDRVRGVLVVYLDAPNSVDARLIGWLQRLAANIVYALRRFEREERIRGAEEALRASEARFRSLVEMSSDSYWEIDEAFCLRQFEGGRALHDESAAPSTLGRPLWGIADAVTSPPESERIRQTLARQEPFRDLEYSFRDRHGHVRYMNITGEPLFDGAERFIGFRGMSRDVTRRKRAEALVALEHAVTRSLAEAETSRRVLQAVMRVICESEQWDVGGYFTVEDARGTTSLYVGWIGSGSAQATADYYKALKPIVVPTGGLLSRVVLGGEPIWVPDMTEEQTTWKERVRHTNAHAAFSFPVWSEGKVTGVFAFSSESIREPDASLLRTVRVIGDQVGQFMRRKDAETELRRHRDHLQELVAEQTADLRRAVQEAESANRAKTEFLSNISHELRTPMHAILSFSDIGKSRAASDNLSIEKAGNYFERIHESAGRLLHLLTALLDFAKLDAGKMEYSMTPTDVGALARSIVSEFETLLQSRQVRLRLDLPMGLVARCDAPRMGQVFRNLIANALKWTPNDGEVRVAAMRADPAAESVGQTAGDRASIELAISDTGPGIPDAELETIFDAFVQSSRTKTGAGGTGLGLAICHKIVADHGGRIWAENNPVAGATFRFTLPLGEPERDAPA